MKHNLENIPEVSIDKVDAFYVTGTRHRDAAGKTNNLKLDLKKSTAVLYTPQTLTDAQKSQVRTNIGSDESTLELLYSIFGEDYVKTEIAKRQYLTFEAVNANTNIFFLGFGDAKTISVSTDNGTTWTEKTSSQEGTALATLSAGEKLLVKGNNATYGTYVEDSGGSGFMPSSFSASDSTYVYGNIMSLVAGDDFANATTLTAAGTFYLLFNSGGMSDPNTTLLFDANHKLVLPATTLADYCYSGMFYGCTGLVTAPELPATTLVNTCYFSMFRGCTDLTSAPALPATTLAKNCYFSMFEDCTSLTSAPALPATTLVEDCYKFMFNGCTSLTAAPELPATTLADYCYSGMFYGCTSLTGAPVLPATTLAESCYRDMFRDCTGLTSAPELPATTLAKNCYESVFNGCTSLTSAPELPATTLAEYCYNGMFYGCSSLTVSPELPATTLVRYCYGNMFRNCTGLITAPSIAATTLATNCCTSMFRGCSLLTTAPDLIATTLVSKCYDNMFDGCTSLNYIKALFTTTPSTSYTNVWVRGVAATGTFVKNPEATWNVTGDNGVPSGWTVTTHDWENEHLTFEAVNANTDVTFTATEEGDILTVSVSTDGGTTWTDKQTSTSGTLLATLGAGEKLLVKGTNSCYGPSEANRFSASNSVYVYGNVMSLIAGDDFVGATSLTEDYALYGLFSASNNANLIFDANHILVLPATTLSPGCYGNMFQGCTSLTSAPELPATTLAENCYSGMFRNCTSLTTAPNLLATTLADYCYGGMFSGCTGLTSAPTLLATTLAEGCYSDMFRDCTSLASAPALPATTLAEVCYKYMFSGCTSLASAPELPATTLVVECYKYMFDGCTSLSSVKCLAETTAIDATTYWLQNVAATGTFTKSPDADFWTEGANGIPSGWTATTQEI